jgi:hypothetical protein
VVLVGYVVMNQTPASRTLRQFRTDLYDAFDRRADALFELTDALLSTGPVAAPVHLSQAPEFRWVQGRSGA